MTKRSGQHQNSVKPVVGKPFQKGKSGNPSGRPKLPAELKDRAQIYSVEALDVLHAIAADETQPAPARVSAAVAIMDRGFGKPTANIVASVGTLGDLIEASFQRYPDGPPEY